MKENMTQTQEENMTHFVIEAKSSFKKNNLLAAILIVAFVALAGAGGTYAYLHVAGNQTPNRFTTDKGLNVDLVEPAWTKAVSDNDTDGYPNVASDGTSVIPAAANNFSGVAAEGETAVTKIEKDPYVVNTSMVGNESDQPGADAYVGIRLTFQKWVATKTDKTGENHTETGKYVNMTQDEVNAFFNCYQLNVTGTTAKKTDSKGATVVENYGMILNDGWTQYISGKAQTKIAVAPQMYFIYSKYISSVGSKISGEYPAAQSTASAGKTRTSLFRYIQLVNNDVDVLSKFNALLRVSSDGTANVTTDPGWRILVDTAAVDCGDRTETSIPNARLTDLSTSTIYPDVLATGASPSKNNGYWDEETQKTKGSAYGEGATNAPESKWEH